MKTMNDICDTCTFYQPDDTIATFTVDDTPLVVMYTMADCHLCHQCKKLLQHWKINYATMGDFPEYDVPYPILYVDGKKHSYEMFLQKIMKGEIGT